METKDGLSDEVLAEIVRRARCRRCQGKGFRLAPAEDHLGEKISGKFDKLECPECDGNGLKLGLCRQLAREALAAVRSTPSEGPA